MNRYRIFAVAAILLATLGVPAQQSAGGTDSSAGNQSRAADGVPTAEIQMKFFTEKLDLTAEQQVRIQPILVELHDATVKVVEDSSLSKEQRTAQIWPLRLGADKKIRAVLTDDQKRKLDQVEQEPHWELHGDVDGV